VLTILLVSTADTEPLAAAASGAGYLTANPARTTADDVAGLAARALLSASRAALSVCLRGARLCAACVSGACLSGDTSGDTPGDVLVADLTASSILGNIRRHKPHELHGLCPSFSVILPIFY
jgi:hypothetical protein